MKTTTCFAVAMFAFAINLGCFAKNSDAQPMSFNGYDHSGDCAGGCSHGNSNDSLELIPYGQAGYRAMRQTYPPQRISPYGRSDLMSDGSGYAQQFSNNTPYRATQRPAYQGSQGMQYDRRGRHDYDTRREDFTYANAIDSSYSSRGTDRPGGCRGSCSHANRGGYDSQGYERGGARHGTREETGQSGFERGSQYGNEADRVPQLNTYRPRRIEQSAAYYGRTPPRRSLQMRQEYITPQTPGGIGMSSQEMFSQIGPPPTSLGIPSDLGSSGCGHAGCNHDHN